MGSCCSRIEEIETDIEDSPTNNYYCDEFNSLPPIGQLIYEEECKKCHKKHKKIKLYQSHN